jgi:hypothetical protein
LPGRTTRRRAIPLLKRFKSPEIADKDNTEILARA